MNDGTANATQFAVIVVAWGRPDDLGRTLAALLEQDIGRDRFELCVVHNGGAEAAKPTWAAGVDRWVEAGGNLGCSAGRNLGAQSTTAPLLIFVDDDGVPASNFISALWRCYAEHRDVLAVRGRAEALDHRWLSTLASNYNRGSEVVEDMLTLEGASLVRRDAYERAGGFDPQMAGHEGMKLSLRMLRAFPGQRILYCPDAVLRHDYLRGLRHLLQKAKRNAVADRRFEAGVDDELAQARQLLRSMNVPDGRSFVERRAAWFINKVYRLALRWYRLQGP